MKPPYDVSFPIKTLGTLSVRVVARVCAACGGHVDGERRSVGWPDCECGTWLGSVSTIDVVEIGELLQELERQA